MNERYINPHGVHMQRNGAEVINAIRQTNTGGVEFTWY